jgi:hypothetical protein
VTATLARTARSQHRRGSTTGETPSNRRQVKLHQEQAVRAVRLAAPFNLPADFYDAWKVIRPTFDRRLPNEIPEDPHLAAAARDRAPAGRRSSASTSPTRAATTSSSRCRHADAAERADAAGRPSARAAGAEVVAADLSGSGLFKPVGPAASAPSASPK